MTEWSGLSRIAVYICTTDGPIRIERISNEPAALSEVFVGRGVNAIMPMSDAYEEFVRDNRPVSRAFGPFPHKAFRLDLDRAVQSGNSWHLAVFVAHGLAAADRLAGPGEVPQLALFLTGAVDADFHVGPVGHLAEKQESLSSVMDRYRADGVETALFAPADDPALTSDLLYRPVGSAMEIVSLLGLEKKDTFIPLSELTSRKTISVSKGRWVLGGGLLILTALGLFAGYQVTDGEIVKADAVQLSLSGLYPPEGRTCAAIQFGQVDPVRRVIPVGREGQTVGSVDDLCGLDILLTGKGDYDVHLIPETGWFVGMKRNEQGVGMPLERQFRDRMELSLDIPRHLPDGLAYRIVVSEPGDDDREEIFFHRLIP